MVEREAAHDNFMDLGLIHIYTGTGKGKTTSAVGLATRALGNGLKVCYVSFHKRPEKYGYTEMKILTQAGALVLNRAKGHPHLDRSIDPAVVSAEAYAALDELEAMLAKEHYDLLIMDEIIISVRDEYITEQRLIDFVQCKPENLELVMTGRGATPALMELADYVSEVNKVKHPFDQGIMSRSGIEY